MVDLLGRDTPILELTADPTALAPERMLVFEVRGSITDLTKAIAKIPGMECIDEEELEGDSEDKEPVAYLLVPDLRALKEILSLWNIWRRKGKLGVGLAPWGHVFSLLRDLRLWGPSDRINDDDRDTLAEEIEGRDDSDRLKLEVELVFRSHPADAEAAQAEVGRAVAAIGGRRIHQSRIEDINYHAMLVELPVSAIRPIVERGQGSIAGLHSVHHIRPQSLVSIGNVADTVPASTAPRPRPDRPPILALLDGVPIAAHPLLAGRLSVDDIFDLDNPEAETEHRVHGTAMASLITLGDRNRQGSPLLRRLHMIPVMSWNGASEAPPDHLLIVDIIYQAALRMRDGKEASAPEVLIVNLSLGNPRLPFHGQMSAWARLLDRLAWKYGLLFIVSAGNAGEKFPIPAYQTSIAFEGATVAERTANTLRAVDSLKATRRIIAPAETVNGVTVGALNEDAVSMAQRLTPHVDPYPGLAMANPSSRLGPGFGNATKPDILMPGAREHLRIMASGEVLEVRPTSAARQFGLKVAAPVVAGQEAREGYTGGTSAAAALASRTCHRIHDALEEAYGSEFTELSHHYRAVILKALLVHPARWPDEAANLIRETVGPASGKQHVRQKDNIRRFLGCGVVDGDDAVACAGDRATFWATGVIEREQSVFVDVPIPLCINGQTRPHGLWATVAWFTPVRSGRQGYRAVRLSLLDPGEMKHLRVTATSNQPDSNQSKRGTVISRRWMGDRAPAVTDGMAVRLVVQREPDTGTPVDDPIPFGLAVTLAMPEVVDIYDQVLLRLAIQNQDRLLV